MLSAEAGIHSSEMVPSASNTLEDTQAGAIEWSDLDDTQSQDLSEGLSKKLGSNHSYLNTEERAFLTDECIKASIQISEEYHTRIKTTGERLKAFSHKHMFDGSVELFTHSREFIDTKTTPKGKIASFIRKLVEIRL